MKVYFSIFIFVTALIFSSCTVNDDNGNTGNTGNTGDTGDTGDTGNTGNTGDTANSGTDSDTETTDDVEYTDHPCYDRSGDADGDGISNKSECPEFPCQDLDGDDLPDCLDTDSDGDSISDSTECPSEPCLDTDEDEMPDFVDRDSDNDGLSDKKEQELGTDHLSKDTDGDNSDDLAEIVYGSDPNDPNSKIPDGLFYVVLPYGAPDRVHRALDFNTNITKVDVAILLDLSGSMGEELGNLKAEIKTKIIEELPDEIPGMTVGFSIAHFMDWNKNNQAQIYTVDQYVTTDGAEAQTSLDNMPGTDGGTEPHEETLYQAASGEGLTATMYQPPMGASYFNLAPVDCTGKEGNIGGMCFRELAMPIFIMITDEDFSHIPVGKQGFGEEYWDENAPGHTLEDAILAMNGINAKFIGIDSSFSCSQYDASNNCIAYEQANYAEDDYKTVAQGTASLDKDGNPFLYHTENADGSGMSDQIADAVVSLTTYVQMDVTTSTSSDEECDGTNVSEFVVESVPFEATPPEGIASKDDTTFYKVEPGTMVSFDVYFKNEFCLNNSLEPIVYEAVIRVLGDGAFLSSKKIQIIIPAGDQT